MRRGNGSGSVYKLSGKRRRPWTARITTGFKDNGQAIYKYLGYFPTRKEAMLCLADYIKDPYEVGVTFERVYKMFMESVTWKEYTKYQVKGRWKVLEPLYNQRIGDLTVSMVIDTIEKANRPQRQSEAVKTLAAQICDYASDHNYLPPGRGDMIRRAKVKTRPSKKIKREIFSKEEIAKLWRTESEDLLMLIYSGLRMSEYIQLTKEDIDLERQIIYVRQSKTVSGERTVPIADCTLRFWERREQPLSYSHFYRLFEKTDHRPHDTRHTCVSLLQEAEVPEAIIKSIVGHKGDVTDRYTHISNEKKLEAINRI